MSAFNWITIEQTCPSCGHEASIRCVTHAAADFGGDAAGRFHEREYRVGEKLAWWSSDDPRYSEWRVDGRLDGQYRCFECDEEACYATCLNCGAELVVVLGFRSLVIENVVSINIRTEWPDGYRK